MLSKISYQIISPVCFFLFICLFIGKQLIIFLAFVGFKADVAVFEWLLSKTLPEIHKHFKQIGLEIELLVAPWFLSLFVNDLPMETAYLVSMILSSFRLSYSFFFFFFL